MKSAEPGAYSFMQMGEKGLVTHVIDYVDIKIQFSCLTLSFETILI